MTTALAVRPSLKDQATWVKEALEDDIRYGKYISHTRRQICQDDSEIIPNMLNISFQGVQFFFRISRDQGTLEQTRPKVKGETLGQVLIGSPTFADDMAEVLSGFVLGPVVINDYGEAIRSSNSGTKDSDGLGRSSDMAHYLCNGSIDRNEVSELHDALSCRKCNLRVIIPNGIDTWGKFRQYADEHLL